MSFKRSRATFETEDHVSFAIYGSPLPHEEEARDDGSYLPLWKQEVRDERGRKRLHGAFTGGFSAGYFNTVGSKEGWTPSTFVSSRANRHKNVASTQQRVEDYMDEEDLADKAEAQKLQTSDVFAGIGSSAQSGASRDGLESLLKPGGSTMGFHLLRRMGWKDGQGIGPKIRRTARLDLGQKTVDAQIETYLFAPDDVPMIAFLTKKDRKGLGHRGETKPQGLGGHGYAGDNEQDQDSQEEAVKSDRLVFRASERSKPKPTASSAFGVGVLNDTGSDDEDPYEMGPKIKYSRVLGGDKKKRTKKKASAIANPTLTNIPKFMPKISRAGDRLRRCHDGRLPPSGFVLSQLSEDFASLLSSFAPPPVPPDWTTTLRPLDESNDTATYMSTADAAKVSNYNPQSRAALLGEQALPGKSIFAYLSADARDKIAAASGKADLPQAGGDVPEAGEMSAEAHNSVLWNQVPKLDRESAVGALARIFDGPYADDEAKRARYKRYLEQHCNAGLPFPTKLPGISDQAFVQELNEFYNCARIFKPMTGFMASRFTTSKATQSPHGSNASAELMSKPEPKVADAAEEAAKMGMFGHLTRSVADFYPSRLLCKRFNVKPPAHARPDNVPEGGDAKSFAGYKSAPVRFDAPPPSSPHRDAAPDQASGTDKTGPGTTEGLPAPIVREQTQTEQVDPERNEAVEAAVANADVLRAIFGDDSDSE